MPPDAGATTSSPYYEAYVPRCSNDRSEYRIRWIVDRLPRTTKTLVDLGCGLGRNLSAFAPAVPDAELLGVDVASIAVESVRALGFRALRCDFSAGSPLAAESVDVVVCGEVIEHVVDTDAMLIEIRRVLSRDGRLFLTTPNLAYAVNRLLLLAGIQPIFTETSLHRNLGRRLAILGQGKATQGHLKIFTRRALEELLVMHGFEIVEFAGYNMFDRGVTGWLDRLLRRVPSLGAGFLVSARIARGA